MKQWREINGRRTLGEFQSVDASIDHLCGELGITVNTDRWLKP